MSNKLKKIKIAIIGSHGVGKTTFCNDLFNILNDNPKLFGKINLLPEWAFSAYKAGFPINEATTREAQLWIIMRQIEKEKYTPPTWITDKCLLDSLAYGLFLIKSKKYREIMSDLIKKNADYDFVFYLPVEFPLENDGYRSMDPLFQKKIDKSIKSVFKELKIKYYIISGSRKKRILQAKKILWAK